jgi:hypothetical protein
MTWRTVGVQVSAHRAYALKFFAGSTHGTRVCCLSRSCPIRLPPVETGRKTLPAHQAHVSTWE